MHQNRIVQYTLAFSCLIVQQVCGASSSLAEKPMAIEADAKMVENCQFLKTLTGYSFWSIGEAAIKDARRRAAKMGATHIVVGQMGSDPYGGSPSASVRAYQCDQTTGAGTTPQSTQGINPAPGAETVQTKQDIYKVASETTVLIRGKYSASGVIIAKEGKTYYVLTAKHAVNSKEVYTVTTSDGKDYSVDYSQVKKLTTIDLAVVPFASSQDYPIARLGNSDQVKQGDNVYVSGWPGTEEAITKRTHLVTDGRVVGLQKGDADGYELMYGNSTAPGMSGGPVLDSKGLVVGIHGRAAGNKVTGKVGINLGIPVNLFLRLLPETGLNMQKIGLKAQK
jgi:S1-C subfamily serine protease